MSDITPKPLSDKRRAEIISNWHTADWNTLHEYVAELLADSEYWRKEPNP